MAKVDAIRHTLESLRDNVPDLLGVLLVSTDGLPITGAIGGNVDPASVAATAAAVFKAGRKSAEAVALGHLAEVTVSGDAGHLLLYGVTSRAVMAVVAPMDANIGLIHLEARNSVRELIGVLGAMGASA